MDVFEQKLGMIYLLTKHRRLEESVIEASGAECTTGQGLLYPLSLQLDWIGEAVRHPSSFAALKL